jgi:hypothetical protein
VEDAEVEREQAGDDGKEQQPRPDRRAGKRRGQQRCYRVDQLLHG